jgi:hypothetical protein
MEFYLPTTTGEWLAWGSAAVTALAGLVMLFAPGITMKLLRLQPINGRPEGYGSIRATLALSRRGDRMPRFRAAIPMGRAGFRLGICTVRTLHFDDVGCGWAQGWTERRTLLWQSRSAGGVRACSRSAALRFRLHFLIGKSSVLHF